MAYIRFWRQGQGRKTPELHVGKPSFGSRRRARMRHEEEQRMRRGDSSWSGPGAYLEQGRETSTLARVMGLLGLAAVFTAVGAVIGPALGDIGFWVALIGGLLLI